MASRAENTTKYAKAYVKAGKGERRRILDQVVEVTGWSRDNARRRLIRPRAARRCAAAFPRLGPAQCRRHRPRRDGLADTHHAAGVDAAAPPLMILPAQDTTTDSPPIATATDART